MNATPLDDFFYEETFGSSPLRISRARRVSDGRQALVYELTGPSHSLEELAHYRESDERILAATNTPIGVLVAFASEGTPLGALEFPLAIGEFLPVALGLTEAIAQLHERVGFYRYLNNATILATPGVGGEIVPPVIASLLGKELRMSEAQNGLPHLSFLHFMAPEQTGRMNVTPDTRGDFYSLGVAWYEMLTGHLPFESDDALELIHSHLARPPRAPHQLNPAVPPVLSNIILKLLAKTPEERYQGTFGLRNDLRKCHQQWQNTGEIEFFTLGLRDVPERLNTPIRLYGREVELKVLHQAFEAVRSAGQTSLLLIGGYSGVGKTALAQALRPVVAQSGGYFLAGKIDQFRRNIPYASITEAFRGLMRQLHTEPEERLSLLRRELLTALENNGQVIADVIPEIELIIGPQPPVPELGSHEAQIRFNRVFQSLISVIAHPGQPLVLFLDDLQWMDAASLKFLEALMESRQNLLIIGAYRDNEVSPSHPLVSMIIRVEEARVAQVRRLILAPLSEPAVAQLLADTLYSTHSQVTPIAQLLIARTDGNAFFLLQFLQQLYTDGLLRFERTEGRWVWDELQIQHAEISGDVVELMAAKIRTLAPAARTALPVASCLGNRFDIETLALVRNQNRESLLSDLQEALESGLLVPLTESSTGPVSTLRFLHDRVQQAAYSLLSEDEKIALHARAGRLLAEQARIAGIQHFDERIFEIADHLNRGWTARQDEIFGQELAEINLHAMRKARNALAYDAAAKYAMAGMKVLPRDAWSSHHDLVFALTLGWSACEILQGLFVQAEERLKTLHRYTTDRRQKTQIYRLQITAYTTQTRMAEATQVGIEALRQFGIHLPLHPGKPAIIQEVLQARRNLGFRRPGELLNSPMMSDPEAIATVQIIMATVAAAFQSDVLLWTLLTLRTVNLSLRFGNTTGTAGAFANYAIVLCAPLGQFRTALEFSEVAMRLSDQAEFAESRSQAYFTAGAFIAFWHHPLSHGIGLLQQSYETGPQNGEFVYASYSALHMVFHRLFQGDALSDVDGQIDEYLDFVHRVQYKEGPEYLRFFRQFIACLQGRTDATGSFANSEYDEAQHVREIGGYVNKLPLMYYSTLKLEALYLLKETEQARRIAARYEHDPKNIEQLSSMLFSPAFHFYNAMTQAALYPQARTRSKRRYRLNLELNRRRFQKWAQLCPTNFAHLAALLEAELYRIKNNWRDAQEAYENAIDLAEKHGFIHHAALGHERVGTLHLEQASRTRASYHLSAAHTGFAKWGATAKVRMLETQYGPLLRLAPPNVATQRPANSALATSAAVSQRPGSHGSVSATLDLGTVVKASQAISGEIEWTRLLKVLMNIAIENAGAQRGVLLIENEGELRLAAQGEAGAIEVEPLEGRVLTREDVSLVPFSVVNYVARTRESVVLSDARDAELFSNDAFITQGAARSLLCTPIVNQGNLVGVLYLQNNLAEGAFTEDRLQVLTLLAAQAAVSLEAARAYADVRKSQNQLQSILDNATTVIYMKDLQGRYLMVNGEFTRSIGITKENIIGRTAFEVLPPESAARIHADEQRITQKHQAIHGEETFTFSGEARTYITVKFPLLDAEGNLYAFGGVSTDITERKRAEQLLANYSHTLEEQVAQRTLELRQNNQQLQQTLEQLQDAQQRMILQENLAYLGTLTAGVAHEIQNPLNFVINFAQVSSILVEDLRNQLESVYETSATPIDEYLIETVSDLELNAAKINEHGQRINTIVKSMLLHSRGISPPAAPAQLNALLEESTDLVYHALRADKPEANIYFQKHLDPILNEEKVSVVAQDLSRVFTNIIGNAAYAVLKKQETLDDNFIPTITLVSQSNAENVEFRIRDNGGGIPAEQREEIFKPFFTTKPTGEGTGLGLSICYNIVTQEHNGDLSVESQTDQELADNSNRGFTEFIICLPKNVANQ